MSVYSCRAVREMSSLSLQGTQLSVFSLFLSLSLLKKHFPPCSPPPQLSLKSSSICVCVLIRTSPIYGWMAASLTERLRGAHTDVRCVTHSEGRKGVYGRERDEKGVWGLLQGVLMMQFPLRGGPPICEWNRQDLACTRRKIKTDWTWGTT